MLVFNFCKMFNSFLEMAKISFKVFFYLYFKYLKLHKKNGIQILIRPT